MWFIRFMLYYFCTIFNFSFTHINKILETQIVIAQYANLYYIYTY